MGARKKAKQFAKKVGKEAGPPVAIALLTALIELIKRNGGGDESEVRRT